MEWIKLIGILVILVGFLLKLDTIAVVIVAGFVTALVSGISVVDFLTMLGEAFVNNRLVTLFLLTLPMVGLSERFGLKQQAVILIEKIKGLTPGKFLSLYLFIRELAGFSLFGSKDIHNLSARSLTRWRKLLGKTNLGNWMKKIRKKSKLGLPLTKTSGISLPKIPLWLLLVCY